MFMNNKSDLNNRVLIEEFQKAYPSKKDKECALTSMDNDAIEKLILATDNISAKIFYSKYLKR